MKQKQLVLAAVCGFLGLVGQPARVNAHWSSKGPYGGALSNVTVSDTNVLVGTFNGGVFFNTGAAATIFAVKNDGLLSGHINDFAQVGSRFFVATADAGVFLSPDRGSSWTAANSGLSATDVQCLLTAQTHLIAGTPSGAYISSDTGATWTAVSSLSGKDVRDLTMDDDHTLYAATYGGGVYKSADDGLTWTTVNSGLSGNGLNLTSIAADGGMLYAANESGAYMYMGMWMAFNDGLTNTHITALARKGSTIYASTYGGLFKSVGMGDWTATGTGLPADTLTSVAVKDTLVFVASLNQGLYRAGTTNYTFAQTNTGINNLETYALATLDTNNILTANNKGVFYSTDLAADYTSINAGLTDSLNVTSLILNSDKMLAGTKNNGVYIRTAGDWYSFNNGLADSNIVVVAQSTSQDNYYLATAAGHVYKRGVTEDAWTDITSGLPSNLAITSMVLDGNMIYLGTYGNGVYMYMGMSGWEAMNTDLTNQNVTALAMSDEYLYAGTDGGGVFKGGMSMGWMAVNEGLPSLNIEALGASDSFVVASYKGGAYVTNNGGTLWQIPGIILHIPSFANVNCVSLAATRCFIGTDYNSLYSNAITEFPTDNGTGVHNINNNAAKVVLYPNPNNGSFTLNIVPAVNVKVKRAMVLDITGKEVAELSDQLNQQVSLSLAGGTYYLIINTTAGSAVQKFVLTR